MQKIMSSSWISRHVYQSPYHGILFRIHGVGFGLYILFTSLHMYLRQNRKWHSRIGLLNLSVTYPVLIASGALLCPHVDPASDAVIFMTYGASFALLYIQQILLIRRVWFDLSWLHCILMERYLYVFWYCYTRTTSKHSFYPDMLCILFLMPWLHLLHPLLSTHRKNGLQLWYTGILGTVFSFTHAPYHDLGCFRWLLYIMIHLWLCHGLMS